MIAGKDAPTHGEAKNSWLSGTAAMNYVAITQAILGIQPQYDGLAIRPVIPADWQGFEVVRYFRGVRYEILGQSEGSGNTVALVVDGKPVPGTGHTLTRESGTVKVIANIGQEVDLMKKNHLLPAFILFLVIGILAAGCGGTAQSSAIRTPYPTPVKKTYTVQRGDIVINANLFGSVTPLALDTVYFQMDGTVGDVYVQVDDMVKKGELLADLQELQGLLATATTTEDVIQRAQDNLSIAQLTLSKLEAQKASTFDIQIQEKYIDLAQLDFKRSTDQIWIDPKNTDPFGEINAQVDKARVYAPADGVIISSVNPVGRSLPKPPLHLQLVTAASPRSSPR